MSSKFIKYKAVFGKSCYAVITGSDSLNRLTVFNIFYIKKNKQKVRRSTILFQADYKGLRWKPLLRILNLYIEGKINEPYINLNEEDFTS